MRRHFFLPYDIMIRKPVLITKNIEVCSTMISNGFLSVFLILPTVLFVVEDQFRRDDFFHECFRNSLVKLIFH